MSKYVILQVASNSDVIQRFVTNNSAVLVAVLKSLCDQGKTIGVTGPLPTPNHDARIPAFAFELRCSAAQAAQFAAIADALP